MQYSYKSCNCITQKPGYVFHETHTTCQSSSDHNMLFVHMFMTQRCEQYQQAGPTSTLLLKQRCFCPILVLWEASRPSRHILSMCGSTISANLFPRYGFCTTTEGKLLLWEVIEVSAQYGLQVWADGDASDEVLGMVVRTGKPCAIQGSPHGRLFTAN